MAKMPFRGIAQIVTAKDPQPLPAAVSAPAPRQQVQTEARPGLRPIGFDAVESEAGSLRARLAHWWSAIKRYLVSLSG